MVFEIKGKFSLVTGGAQGLGLEYSKELLSNGLAGVLIADIDKEKGLEAVANLNKQFGENKAIFANADVTKADELKGIYKTAISKFGALDIIINNAGILRDREYELEININCTAVVRSTLLAMKYLGKNTGGRGGVIVNISSVAGLRTLHFCPIYTATKHFIQAFTRSLADPFYFNLTGVTFRVICPGVTDTSLISNSVQSILQDFPGLDKSLEAILEVTTVQKVEPVAKALIKAIVEGENGSVWCSSENKLYTVNFPDMTDMFTQISL